MSFDHVEVGIQGQPIRVYEGLSVGYLSLSCVRDRHSLVISVGPTAYEPVFFTSGTLMGSLDTTISVVGNHYGIDQTQLSRAKFLDLIDSMHGASSFELAFDASQPIQLSTLLPDGPDVILADGYQTTREAMGWLFAQCGGSR